MDHANDHRNGIMSQIHPRLLCSLNSGLISIRASNLVPCLVFRVGNECLVCRRHEECGRGF